MRLFPVGSAIIFCVLLGSWFAPERASAHLPKTPEPDAQQVDTAALDEGSIILPSSPCDNVLVLASTVKNTREAEFILGGCLAARGPAHMQLQAAHALMLLADKQDMACKYAAILESMLEYPQPEIEPSSLEKIAADTQRQVCQCVRKWNRNLSTPDVAPTSERHGDDVQWHTATSIKHMPGFDFELQVHQDRAMDHLCIFAGDEVRYFESRGTVTSGFEESEFFVHGETGSPTAVIIWRLGVHGQALQLLDLETGEQILQRNSDWPVTYNIQNNRIEYQYHQTHDDGKPEVVEEHY